MPNRREVIAGLKELSLEAYGRWVHCQNTDDELINGIKDWVDDAVELLEKQPEIVRCEDCLNGGLCMQTDTLPYIRCRGQDHNPDWFCADGKRSKP